MTPPASLVVQTSFLGDVILTTPLLTELARRGPVDVVVTPAAAPLLANHPAVRDVLVYDKRGADRGVAGIRRLAGRVGSRSAGVPRDVGVAYFAQMSLRSALVPWLARVPRRVGWTASRAGRVFYTERVPYDTRLHHAERCWRLAFGAAEPTGTMPAPSLHPGEAERAAVDALLGDGDPRPIVVVAPGSVWGTKRWPWYPELAALLAGEFRVVVTGGPGDRLLAEPIVAAAPAGRVLDATGKLPLLASAELIRRAAVLVTNDSSPEHMASAVGTPTVAIFGPTIPGFGFGPLAPKAVVVQHEAMPCRPCHHHGPATCPLGHFKCMRELTAARVRDAVLALRA